MSSHRRTKNGASSIQQVPIAPAGLSNLQETQKINMDETRGPDPLKSSRWSTKDQQSNSVFSRADKARLQQTAKPLIAAQKEAAADGLPTSTQKSRVVKDMALPSSSTPSSRAQSPGPLGGSRRNSKGQRSREMVVRGPKPKRYSTKTHGQPTKTAEATAAITRDIQRDESMDHVNVAHDETIKKVKPGLGKKKPVQEDVKPVLLDADFVRNNMPYPAPGQYPQAPKYLFNEDLSTIGHDIHNDYLRSGSTDQIKTTFLHLAPNKKTKKSASQDGRWTCSLRVNIPDLGPREVIGEGNSKKASKNSAWIHMVSLLHMHGELVHLFQDTKLLSQHPAALASTNVRIAPGMAKIESDAVVDLYNYAARYALVPDYKVTVVSRRKQRPVVQVDIALPQWSVKSSGTSLDITTAEASAVLDFKAQAESFHQDSESAPSKDFIITTQNAKQFLELCKSCCPSMNIDVRVETVELKGTRWQAQMTVNGQAVGQPVPRRLKDQAVEIMNLTSAVHLAHQVPDLLENFAQASRGGGGLMMAPVPPINAPIDYHSELVMMDSLKALVHSGLPDEKESLTGETGLETRHFRRKRRLQGHFAAQRSEELAKKLAALGEDRSRIESQAKLPMNSYSSDVLELVSKNVFAIIVGATGSGKTTQVPRILLDDAVSKNEGAHCNIICTQPRRIAATSVARRVASERGEQIGDSVGYHVRFDARHPRNGGSILYCTTGILLEQLKHSPEDVMDSSSHIIIDEVHERDMLIDFLMINLRNIVQTRLAKGKRVPKIVLMSATLDTQLFADYFGTSNADGSRIPCPSISVPGRTFPVKEYFLEDVLESIQQTYSSKMNDMLRSSKGPKGNVAMVRYLDDELAVVASDTTETSESQTTTGIDWKKGPVDDSENISEDASSELQESFVPLDLVAATIGHICTTTQEGAILAFLPGLEEITKTSATLLERQIYGCSFGDNSKFRIHMLHSTVPHEAQQEVFATVPEGCRKIILSTNIAETSITIPDVRYVIDTGKLRETRYDQVKRITRLQTVWASKSNVRQRAGRAGRVQDGHYFGLFSRGRHQSLRAAGLPELLRSDLQETCLAVKAQRFTEPIQQFLSQAIEPPSPTAVRAAVAELKSLEAFTPDEILTDLGRILSKMPVHPSLGKMIIFGIIFRCLDPMLLLGAASEERSIFARPMGERAQANDAKKSFGGYGSDHISFLQAFNGMRQTRDDYGVNSLWDHARAKYLHVGAFNTIERCAQQIASVLADSGLVPDHSTRRGTGSRYTPPTGIGGAELNINAGNHALIRALLVAGFHPNLVSKQATSKAVFRAPSENNVYIHPSSLNNTKKGASYAPGTLFAYSSLAKSPDGKMLFFRESTKITPLMAMLFGGHLRLDGKLLTMDDWLPFRIKSDDDYQTAKTILEYRKALDRLLRTAFRSLTSRREDPTQPYLANIPMVDQAARDVAELLELEQDPWQSSSRSSRW